MRYLLGSILLIFLGALGLFAFQNTQPVTVTFWNKEIKAPLALFAVSVYFLGMFSGWSVVAFLRNSISRVSSHSQPNPEAKT